MIPAGTAIEAELRLTVEALERRVVLLEELIAGSVGEPRIDFANTDEIIRFVAFHTGVSMADIYGWNRHAVVVRARDAVVWGARELLLMSYPRIGHRLNRDHSTLVIAKQRANARRETDPAFRMLTDRIRAHFSKEAVQCQV